jgi:hypothetical protein
MPRSVLTGDRAAERPHVVTHRVGELGVTALTNAVGTFMAFRDAFPSVPASLERQMRKRYPKPQPALPVSEPTKEGLLGASWPRPGGTSSCWGG